MGLLMAGTGVPPPESYRDRYNAFQYAYAQSAAPINRAGIAPLAAPLLGKNGKTDKALAGRSLAMEVKRIEAAFNRRLKFMVDHTSHEVTVKVLDPYTNEVIKILPPEEIQLLNRSRHTFNGFLY
ncbi:MAG: flagellar protein FlaG [Treponema sp.]|jgi:flagellar protein FlaG|nr:flagellar protein FlaG [Treponema sp.]